MPYNSGAKSIFFGSTATVHSYFWLCTVAERYFFFSICAFTLLFYYFTIFSPCLSPHSLSICFSLPPHRSAQVQPPQTHCHQPTLQLAIVVDPRSTINHVHRINPLHPSTPHRPNSPASRHRINPMIRFVIHTTSPPL